MESNVQVISKSICNVLLEADDQMGELRNKIQHLDSLLYFLREFFEYTALDVNSPNENIRTHSHCMLAHYREYQSIFEVAFNKSSDIILSANTLEETLSAAFGEAAKLK